MLPTLTQRAVGFREAIVHHSGNGHFAIRQGNWVLIDYPTGDDNKEPDWLKQQRGPPLLARI